MCLPYSENQKIILKLIYNKIGITRAELANETGFSTLTTTKFVSEFIADGIVSEDGTLESTGGRKAVKLKINPDFLYVLSVDIGTYSAKIGIVRLDGSILYREVITTKTSNIPSKVIEVKQLKNKLKELLTTYGKEKFLGLGIGISGLVDYDNKTILFCPNIDGFNGVNVREEFEKFLEIPVFVDTSARCMALAEQRLGIGKNIKNQIFVSIGYGIGAGIIADSKIFRGASGASGELGHVKTQNSNDLCSCGKYGCLEIYATLPMIISRIKVTLKQFHGFSPLKTLISDINDITTEDIVKASMEGDKIVNDILTDIGKMIGVVLSNMANILNPELIVLGGGVIEYLPLVFEEAKRTTKQQSLVTVYQNLSFERSSLGFNCSIIGCAMQLISKYFED